MFPVSIYTPKQRKKGTKFKLHNRNSKLKSSSDSHAVFLYELGPKFYATNFYNRNVELLTINRRSVNARNLNLACEDILLKRTTK